jgi:hypothetical protein
VSEFTYKLEIDHLPAGVYILQVTDGFNVMTKRIIKK